MSYTALYRKWRPRTFDEVVGQDAVCTTLKNQIKSGRIGHAYLFCGTRGTGKTSIAKIMARAVNCEHNEDGNPCNICETCSSIIKEASMNVMEIDAASNNGVDNIRDIREQVQYPPTQGRYRVYIIDEVHMLSTGAFNALLKTLEEPPEYVIFILATTEVHKIPVTVLSRCQRYDFKRISVDIIASRLSELCSEESIDIEEKALLYIAKSADGAMRDALSLLDECVAFHPDERISYDEVLSILGSVDTEVFASVFAAVSEGDTKSVLSAVENIVSEGREISQFVSDFLWYLRNLLVLKTSSGAENLIDASKDSIAAMRESGLKVSAEALMRYIRVLSELSNSLRYSGQKRIALELALIKLTTPQMESNLDSVLERISRLEGRLEEGIPVRAVQEDTGAKPEIKQASPSTVRLPKAQYEDLMLLRKEWCNVIEGLGGASSSIYRETLIEPAGENVMSIVFSTRGFYQLGSRENAIAELTEYVKRNYQKDFVFKTRLKGNNEVISTNYVSEEELGAIVNMEIERED